MTNCKFPALVGVQGQVSHGSAADHTQKAARSVYHGVGKPADVMLNKHPELQQQYTNYKNNLQQLAQRIGDIEQDAEEHK